MVVDTSALLAVLLGYLDELLAAAASGCDHVALREEEVHAPAAYSPSARSGVRSSGSSSSISFVKMRSERL
jgi:hypothetical protein